MNAPFANHNPPRMRGFAQLLAGVLPVMALLLAVLAGSASVGAETAGLEDSFRNLANPDNPSWRSAESDIERAWSKSGSASMDLLLKRGEDSLDAGDSKAAIDHLSALTDHAPDFPEGWNALASAYIAAGLIGPGVSALGTTLKLEPRHWGALASLGGVLEEIGDDARALAAYQASFALNPHQDDVKDAIARLEKKHSGTAL